MGDAYGAGIIEALSKKELQTLENDIENKKNSTKDVTELVAWNFISSNSWFSFSLDSKYVTLIFIIKLIINDCV